MGTLLLMEEPFYAYRNLIATMTNHNLLTAPATYRSCCHSLRRARMGSIEAA
jgi:hypothetical protein